MSDNAENANCANCVKVKWSVTAHEAGYLKCPVYLNQHKRVKSSITFQQKQSMDSTPLLLNNITAETMERYI